MKFLVRPELTTASFVRGLYTDHGRHCWTTLRNPSPIPWNLLIGVNLFS